MNKDKLKMSKRSEKVRDGFLDLLRNLSMPFQLGVVNTFFLYLLVQPNKKLECFQFFCVSVFCIVLSIVIVYALFGNIQKFFTVLESEIFDREVSCFNRFSLLLASIFVIGIIFTSLVAMVILSAQKLIG